MEQRHKSFRGFFDHFALDVACFQVRMIRGGGK
jgi:hypothetical protein